MSANYVGAREVVLPKGHRPSVAVSLDEQLGPCVLDGGAMHVACVAKARNGCPWVRRSERHHGTVTYADCLDHTRT
jgi:hypothetical protein